MSDDEYLSDDENRVPIVPGGKTVLKCPICKKILPPNNNHTGAFKDPLPCSDCFTRFKRRRSSQPRLRRNSDLGTISENSAQDSKFEDLDVSRSISCTYCPKPVILPTSNFINHLKTRHAAFGFENDQIFYEFKNGCDKEHFGQNGTYLPDYICQGGRYFFSQGCNENGVFHGWISFLGSKEEAKRYLTTITIYSQESKGFFNKFKKTPDLQWTIPVQPYRDEQPSANVCYTIRWSQLKPYFQKNCNLKNGSKVKYTWSTRISIFRAD
ncbi:uncharacterized protein LOC110860580 [Folsomia candida]|uniref:Protein SIP5 n=1 Tax=Folsomia candida TaxID=158441 RepID=A0A226D5R7_FOLCA|nr:uncharacterized protein LOC110860580 [Folsomia candida]XP_021965333.1 uncharacterized protein LOC110860580 [Folsomia candida]XP_021965334.1 uncharacterized protein LOC110860580 [Folsomia candida]XP_021965336.1 uncharacterized protein LOC110860580 [Folsomia candida]XP_021965337.1 uncharacterized protein LOC110860580 [Folsomia candida]OXA40559.1 Protein SIP5 [Folsomia candida]